MDVTFLFLLSFCAFALMRRHGRHCKLSPGSPELLLGTSEEEQGMLPTGFESQSLLNPGSSPELPYPCLLSADLCHAIHMRLEQEGASICKSKHITNKI